MKQRKYVTAAAALVLSALLFSGCGEAPAAQSAAPSADAAQATDGGLRLSQTESVRKAAYEGKDDFADFLSAASPVYLIPGLNEAMTPQGMGYDAAAGRVYISSYASGEIPSVLTALDAESGQFIAEYYLYNADGTPFLSHVGGVAVTEDTLYVSAKLDSDGSYSIAAIPLTSLAETGSRDITVSETIPMAVSPSFLSYADGILWVGNFYHPSADYGLPPEMNYTTATADGDYGCYILGFDLAADPDALTVPDGGDYPIPDMVLAAPDKIQGMVYSDGTVLLSQSYGRKNNAALLSYALTPDGTGDTTVSLGGREIPVYILDSSRQTGSMTLMPMSEALCVTPDGNVLILFESGSMTYSDGKYRTDHVWKAALSDLK